MILNDFHLPAPVARSRKYHHSHEQALEIPSATIIGVNFSLIPQLLQAFEQTYWNFNAPTRVNPYGTAHFAIHATRIGDAIHEAGSNQSHHRRT